LIVKLKIKKIKGLLIRIIREKISYIQI